jgi:hypothetical protein
VKGRFSKRQAQHPETAGTGDFQDIKDVIPLFYRQIPLSGCAYFLRKAIRPTNKSKLKPDSCDVFCIPGVLCHHFHRWPALYLVFEF